MIDFWLTNSRSSPTSPSFQLLWLSRKFSNILICFFCLKITIVVHYCLILLGKNLFILHNCLFQIQINSVGLIFFFEPVNIDSLSQLLRVLIWINESSQIFLNVVMAFRFKLVLLWVSWTGLTIFFTCQLFLLNLFFHFSFNYFILIIIKHLNQMLCLQSIFFKLLLSTYFHEFHSVNTFFRLLFFLLHLVYLFLKIFQGLLPIVFIIIFFRNFIHKSLIDFFQLLSSNPINFIYWILNIILISFTKPQQILNMFILCFVTKSYTLMDSLFC